MTRHSPFDSRPDPRLVDGLRAHFHGPDSAGMIARLEGALARLPERDTEWDVLAGWARPRVLAAAMAAGFLLGLTLWRQWWRTDVPPTPISVAILEAPRPVEVNPVMHAILEEEQ